MMIFRSGSTSPFSHSWRILNYLKIARNCLKSMNSIRICINLIRTNRIKKAVMLCYNNIIKSVLKIFWISLTKILILFSKRIEITTGFYQHLTFNPQLHKVLLDNAQCSCGFDVVFHFTFSFFSRFHCSFSGMPAEKTEFC